MNISLQKTQAMVASKDLMRCELALHNKTIDQATKFKYLGQKQTIRNTTQATKCAMVSGSLRDRI